jgi:serine/threonine protein kinase
MIDGEPPYMDLPPMKALLMITTEGIPPLTHSNLWTENFLDFTNSCLAPKSKNRPAMDELLKHPFLQDRSTPEEFGKVVQRAHSIRQSQMV